MSLEPLRSCDALDVSKVLLTLLVLFASHNNQEVHKERKPIPEVDKPPVCPEGPGQRGAGVVGEPNFLG